MDLWDKALEHGTLGNTIAQTIFKILLSTPIFGDKSCSYCYNVISESSFLDHMVSYHDQNTLYSSISTNKAALFKPPLSKCIVHSSFTAILLCAYLVRVNYLYLPLLYIRCIYVCIAPKLKEQGKKLISTLDLHSCFHALYILCFSPLHFDSIGVAPARPQCYNLAITIFVT